MAKIDDILDKNSADIKKGLKKEFDLLMAEVLKSGMSNTEAKKIVKERMKAVYGLNINNLAKGMKEAVGGSWSADSVEKMDIHGVKLSRRLYANIEDVEKSTLRVIKDALKDGKSIKEVSKLLYEGYNFKVDPLDVKKGLPKYLKEDIKTMSDERINKIKTPALKAAYLDTLKAKSEQQLEKSLQRAFYERNRYFADRIAQTEIFKAHSQKVAREMMQDDTLEIVKIRLSRTHPKRDICDYHTGVDKYGLGKGVYPKAKAPRPPYHPHCRCKLMPDITKRAKGAKVNPKADTHFMDGLSRFEKAQILGSQKRVDDFSRSGSVLESGYYDEPLSVGGVGYNSGMEKIEDKIVSNFESIKDDITGKFGNLWELNDSFEKHTKRRFNLGHIRDKNDYIVKTLSCLANSSEYIFAQHDNSWDNICYNKSKDWAVIFNENGKIMTSYKIDKDNFVGFETRHKKYDAKIKKGKVDEKFRKYFNNIRN